MPDWLIRLDERVFLAVNGLGAPALDWFFRAVTWLGHGVVLAVLVLGPMLLFDRPNLRRHLLAMVLSVAVGALAVEAIKWATDRERPARHFMAAEIRGEVEVRMPGDALYDRSFPSGHSQAAFGTATYVSLVYPRWSIAASAAAALVALSRVYLGVHFPSDALVGALLGIVFSVAGFRLWEVWASRRSTSSTSRSG
ncbi:MAG: phosphatase PAP2 family protein [Deltaproteobacteria bacterium]|nr:phosphatase PAP2 family protein [Deltaproteobacteria bacterium]